MGFLLLWLVFALTSDGLWGMPSGRTGHPARSFGVNRAGLVRLYFDAAALSVVRSHCGPERVSPTPSYGPLGLPLFACRKRRQVLGSHTVSSLVIVLMASVHKV